MINCFHWKNRAADFLDGSLPVSLAEETQDHLENCTSCASQLEHFETMTRLLQDQPRLPLPESLRKAPLSTPLPHADPSFLTPKRWVKHPLPWYLRLILESAAILLLVLGGVASAPKLRELYETKIEANLSEFRESLKTKDSEGLETETPGPSTPDATTLAKAFSEAEDPEEEINGEIDDEGSVARQSQLWRFTLKTVSPDELRPVISKTLLDLKLPPETRGLSGIEVPGGIEFDLTVPQALATEIKQRMEQLSPKASGFSWYKINSKRKIPAGKAQVVIWLTQPTQ